MVMFKAGYNSLLEKFVLLSVFLFPLVIVLVKHAGSIIFSLIAIVALFYFFTKALKNNFSRDEKLLFYSCLFLFLAAMLTAWLGGFDKMAWKKMDSFLNLLLIVPLYFLFKQYLTKSKVIWWGLATAVIACGLVAIYERQYGSLYSGFSLRAKAATHPILFADVILSMTFMWLAYFTTQIGHQIKTIENWLWLPVLLLGLTAVFLSGSRGAWVVVPVLVLMMFWQFRDQLSSKKLMISAAVLMAVMLAAYLLPATGIKKRIELTVDNVAKYEAGTQKGSSIGTRFEMWKASLMIFNENKSVGVGWGNYKESAQKLVDDGRVFKSAAAWNHPHNQFLSMMVNGGSIMLLALLLFIIVPLLLLRRSLDYGGSEARAYTLAAMVLIVSYAGYGLSEAILERSIPTVFYAFYLALFFAMVSRSKVIAHESASARSEKISVIVISYNEADRIGDSLSSVAEWADEIILFDNGSTDGTIDIAKQFTDKVFVTDWPGYGKQKQRALNEAQYEWVLSIDADEQLTPELRAEIDYMVSSGKGEIAYRIPWAVTIYNKRLDFGRSGRAPLRLFKREGARFSEASVHEKVLLPVGKVGLLHERLLHFTHRDLKHAMDKFNQYAWLWATERFKKGKKSSMPLAIIHGSWTFIVAFFLRLGFLDGYRGFLMAVHISLYTFNKYAALWTLGLQDKKYKG